MEILYTHSAHVLGQQRTGRAEKLCKLRAHVPVRRGQFPTQMCPFPGAEVLSDKSTAQINITDILSKITGASLKITKLSQRWTDKRRRQSSGRTRKPRRTPQHCIHSVRDASQGSSRSGSRQAQSWLGSTITLSEGWWSARSS